MTREIDPRDLTRSQQARLQGRGEEADNWKENPPIGDLAEELAAEEYGLSDMNPGSWWDAVSPDGDKTEVKSTTARIGDKYPADGRFRVWKGQTTSLVEEEQDSDDVTTFYVFVLFHERDGVLYLERMKPSAVQKLVRGEYGGWDEASHKTQGLQQKLPYDAVIDA